MSFKKIIQNLFEKRQQGIAVGLPSFCTANMTVLEAVLQFAKDTKTVALIEATSNQCNQFGGYTGMTPAMFKDNIYALSARLGLSHNAIILGGDHLGPLPWHTLPASEAMQHAKTLVHDFVLAGFVKIHLDTSMHLGDDDRTSPLTKETIALRGVCLYQTAIEAWKELRKIQPDALHPVFCIGSEVPPAGGTANDEKERGITSAAEAEETLRAYTHQFVRHGLEDAWEHILALVVQLGIDYSNTTVFRYNRDAVAPLYSVLTNYKHLFFEGHSTDFQSIHALRAMCEDGTAILKVGPALTFAYREALTCLVHMEEELISNKSMHSHFLEILDNVMLSNPSNYKPWYDKCNLGEYLTRKYSLLDRARYYISNPEVQKSIHILMQNIDKMDLPEGMIHHYMPMQYRRLINKKIPINAHTLVMDYIRVSIEDYASATRLQELHI